MNRFGRLIHLLVALLVALGPTTSVGAAASSSVARLAPPPLPASFYGAVTLDDANVPSGALVSAWVGGTKYAEAATSMQGGLAVFALDVPADNPDTSAVEGGQQGQTVAFRVADSPAQPTATWQSGTHSRVDIAATSGIAPVAAFGASKALNAALAEDGAKVAAFAGGTGPDAVLKSTGGIWQSPMSSAAPWMIVDLAGEAPHVLHQLVLNGDSTASGVKGFRFQVSTTGTAEADFTTVLSETLARTSTPTTFSFAPTAARYVRLQVLSTWGGTSAMLRLLQVWTRDREGGIASLLEGGPVPAVVAVSSASTGNNPEGMLDESTTSSWISASGQKTNQWAKVRLGGGRVYTVDGVVLQSNSNLTGPRNFEVRVSTTTDADGAFSTVFSGTAAAVTTPQVFDFPAVQARYVQLFVAGAQSANATTITVSSFQVLTPDGANVARLSGVSAFVVGASNVSSGSRAERAIDYSASTMWTTDSGQNTNQWLTVRLLDGVSHLVDRVQVSSDGASGIKAYEIRVSNTTPDNAAFTTVASGTFPNADKLHWISFAPVAAKYVQLYVLSNHNGGTSALWVSEFHVFSSLLGAETVAFDDHSSDADGAITSWSWSFGDGATSTERHPAHTYAAPGTYQVQLTVTDDEGRTAATTWPYTVLPRPAVDFTWTPAVPPEGTETSFTSNASSADGVILKYLWSSTISGVSSTNANVKYTPVDNGTYSVTLEVLDSQLLRSSVTKSLSATNVAPTVEVQPEIDLLWGQEWNTDMWGRYDAISTKFIEAGGGDLNTHVCVWDFGDGRTMRIERCTSSDTDVRQSYPQPGTFTATLTVTDKDGASGSASMTARVAKRASTLYIPRGQATVADGAIDLTVTLVDRIDNARAMAGRSVVLSSGAESKTVTIGADNTARVRLALPAGENPRITASFAGDTFYEPSETLYRPFQAPGLPDSRGTDFWVAFGPNNGEPELKLFISSAVDTAGTVHIPGMQFMAPFTVQANTVATVELPPATEIRASGNLNEFKAPKGVHIEAQDEVTVYGLNRLAYTTDAFLGLPTDMLGTEHFIVGYAPPISYIDPQSFYVAAVEDSTTITFTLPVTMVAVVDGRNATRLPNTPYAVTLNKGEVFMGHRYDGRDFTGGRVVSNKPIAVYGGDPCSNVPHDRGYCDHLVEQLPPVDAWGKEFVTVPLATRKNGDTFRFVAARDGTEVRVNGQLVATLNRGQFHERIIDGPAHIVATQPLLVAQFSNGTQYDKVVSDPFMMLIPPYEQFMSSYTVTTPASGFGANFINVVARQAVAAQIKLDGQPTGATFTPIPGTDFAGAQVAVSTGSHTLSGPLPFGAFMYGFDEADSYGYPGGTYLGPVASVASVALTPKTAQQNVGQEQCVAAAVRDQLGQPLEGVRVDFTIAGANPGSGAALTNAAGQASYCYSGAQAGTDQLTAAVGTLGDTAAITWAPAAPTNHVPEAADQAATGAEDAPLALTLAATDADGDALTYTVVAQPTHGSLSGTAPNLTYTPEADYHGGDQLTFRASDGEADSNVATVTLTITPVNDAPTAGDDTVTTAEDTPLTLQPAALTANDSAGPADEQGQTLTVTAVASATHGVAALAAGAITFTPEAGYSGPASFAYTVCDDGATAGAADAKCATGQVAVTVTPVNDPPVAVDDTAATAEDTAVEVAVLANDTDADTDAAELRVAALADVHGGTALVLGDGRTVRFTPAPDANDDTANGGFGFTYTVTDGEAVSAASGSVTITVSPANDPPALAPIDDQATAWGNALSFTASATDPDLPNDTLAYSLAGAPDGAAIDAASGAFSWTPASSQIGAHTFTVRVSDGGDPAQSAERAVTIVVGKRAARLAYGGDSAGQFSDATTLRATLTDDGGGALQGQPIAGTAVTFTLGGQSAAATTDASGAATAVITLTQAAMALSVSSGVAEGDLYLAATSVVPYAIRHEDAAIEYTGDALRTTSSTQSTSTATVTLAAVVREAADGSLGGALAGRELQFTVYKYSDTALATPVASCTGAVNASAAGAGTASCTVTLTADNYTVISQLQPNGYYAAPAEAQAVTVVLPATGMSTGGGWIDEAGGDERSNFGFTVKYQQKGAIQGNSLYIYRRTVEANTIPLPGTPGAFLPAGEYNWVIKSNAMTGLTQSCTATTPKVCTATFTGMATISAVHRATEETYILGDSYQLRVDVTDRGEPGSGSGQTADTYALRVWSSATGTYYQIGAPAAQVAISGGNIQVKP